MSSQRLITKEGMEAQYKHCMGMRKHKAGETAITFKHDACDFGMLNQAEMTEEMRRWRQLRKEGRIKIEEYNNKLRVIEGINSTLNGKKWYVLTIQPIKDEVAIDPFGLFVLGYMVSGYIYAFDKEENRDAVYKYVMGIKSACKADETEQKLYTPVEGETEEERRARITAGVALHNARVEAVIADYL
jgi:hypothetical protein